MRAPPEIRPLVEATLEQLRDGKVEQVWNAAAPVFTVHPSNKIAAAGADVTLTGGYFGAPPMAYQWLFNGVEIAGATNFTLTVSNASAADAGDYSLILSNAGGTITSAVATVTVTVEGDFIWAQRGGGASNDVTLATLAGGAVDVYIAGYFTDTVDFNGYTRLDTRGNPHSTRLHLVQRVRRTNAGQLAYGVTLDDPVYYTKPWTNERTWLLSNGELIEYSCEENNKDLWEGRVKKWTPPQPPDLK